MAPGKRPFHTIIPAFVTQGGQPVMSFGVMGANMQPQGHVQTLVRMLDHGQNPQAACDASRWRFNQGVSVNAEASMPLATQQGLAALGHGLSVIDDPYGEFARASSSGDWAMPKPRAYSFSIFCVSSKRLILLVLILDKSQFKALFTCSTLGSC